VARRFVERQLVLATHNPGKLAELRELLAGRPVEVLSSAALGLPEPVEDGATFAANAALKAGRGAGELPARDRRSLRVGGPRPRRRPRRAVGAVGRATPAQSLCAPSDSVFYVNVFSCRPGLVGSLLP
jgi:hypothetical protein